VSEPLRIAWVLGWALPESWFAPLAQAAFPASAHTFFSATPDTVERLRTAGPFDWVVGHSLGAQLLLAAGPLPGRVALLSPIFAFPREAGTGGRTALTQLKYLARWLRRDRPSALADFYQRAGLDVPPAAADLPLETLLWGLAQLETVALAPVLPPGWRAWCGAADPLLDADRLHALAPGVEVVPGVTHHPSALIQEFAFVVDRDVPGALPGPDAESALGSKRSTYSDTVISNSFSRAAAGYHRHAHVQADLAAWLADWLPEERAGRLLEIGAGTGLFTRHLSGWPGGVTATDLSPAMCAAGRAAVPSADWQVMGAAHPLPGPWDWICSSAMLQWAEQPAEVFIAWRRVLAPQGRVVAGLFVAGSLPEWCAVSGDNAPLVWRTAAEWRAELARAGLRVIREDTTERVFSYSSARGFLRSLHGVGGAPKRRLAPVVLRQKLRDYEARFSVGPGAGVRATWTFYRFEAEASG